ncbi:60S ribosome subunit biogenesis protein NIP7 homolog [Dermatophagoides pteronyssinus]|uniref:Ribosome biosynthesis protein nip7 n=2 Tax=Dermatophagoides pteronyssinus TaxID=6956 RepID=A0ABQ8JGG7_DERPT|nr:60S ribosome subunit biogenesis protein NIP7 homolog [Dermatophagoides pteronyssinus]KAH9421688.1 ribosome biosynthesis protein nip7 [Dermatophagoides pteronyssinus]
MRPLNDEETRLVLEKLSKYIGENVKCLLERPDGIYSFRLQNERVFYASERMIKLAATIARDNLISFGTCIGKFTKTRKFRLNITALEFMAPYAKYKVWLKPNAEQQFLYGNHILKSGLSRISDNTEQYQGVLIYSMNDLPLGFGVASKSSNDIRVADPMAIVVFHQADTGEYLRNEDFLA